MKSKKIKLGRMEFENPVFGASGCVGHGFELEQYTNIKNAGALSMKTVTYDMRAGNKAPRICEVDCGMMTSIGLQNPGAEVYVKEYLPQILSSMRADQIIISIGGNDIADYMRCLDLFLEACNADQIAAFELNGACPNVKHGGGVMSASAEAMYDLVAQAKKHTDIPIIGKMNTNFASYCEVARGIEAAGADAVYLVNTPMGLRIDIRRRKSMIGNGIAPISGPAIFPQSVLKTWSIHNSVRLPIISSGGIYTGENAIEMLMAGASAVGVGSAQFVNPDAMNVILDEMCDYCDRNNIEDFSELVGCFSL